MNIVASRLSNQHLVGESWTCVEDVVVNSGAVQAQDYNGAAWALSLRLANATKADIDQAFNKGRILRTHVLRPTWHFVLPEDIRWMVKLTAPRIKQAMSYYNRKLELDDAFFARCHKIITRALANDAWQTRAELAQVLAENGIEASGQRLGHIVMQAEIEGLICSGPFSGKQFTYALIADRAPQAKALSREEALALLATRYFKGHGPASLQDFTWWSGLTVADSKLALNLVKDQLDHETYDGKEYWFSGALAEKIAPQILLLSVYDEYVIAYQNYGPIFLDKTKHLTNIFGNARLDYVIVKDGIVIGTWRRQVNKNKVALEVKLEIKLDPEDNNRLLVAAENYSRFLGLPVEIA
ncbi:MAG TPA: winged helix DNA-binding domain-containing protein, partial [Verrucomicrobiae bacterium]|nr:winged helix DNA-binding domain-containing protein [Verrucomicrobiae bacterium]